MTMDSNTKELIHVSVRSRPLLSKTSSLQLISKEPPILLLPERAQTYQFDNVFLEDADQEKVYNDAVKPLVDLVKLGYNCTVFAYGQTGTGKTYTMGSGSEVQSEFHTGIIPRVLDQLLTEENGNNCESEVHVSISFLEIYNGKVYDLFQSDCKSHLPVSGFTVLGLSQKHVESVLQAREWLELGNKSRHTGETRQNSNSSRSHSVFTVYVSTKLSSSEVSGKLNLVDLAGSESVKKTCSTGDTFQEGININQALLCIGQVISALSTKSAHIPYRQSIITRILKESLNIDNYISLIACVSADPEDISETQRTLDFAQRTKKIRCNPEVASKFMKENPDLFSQVRASVKTTPQKTPMRKRSATPRIGLSTIHERNSQISHVEGSLSVNLTPKRTLFEMTDVQQMLSPIVRKYVAKSEALIMERLAHLESATQNTTSRPLRRSLRLLNNTSDGSLENNTPKISLSKLQGTMTRVLKDTVSRMMSKENVQKLIPDEIAKLNQEPGATSSPIHSNNDLLPSKKLFLNESLDSSPIAQTLPPQDFSFKIPLKPPPLAKKNSDISKSSATGRRSIRIANRQTNHLIDLNKSDWIFDSVKTKRKKDNGPETNTNFNQKYVRTPKPNCDAEKPRSIESRYRWHSKNVLKLLNHGTEKELANELASIGLKTAKKILMFRELEGGFTGIEDLLKMPGWGAQKYDRFLTVNFLKTI